MNPEGADFYDWWGRHSFLYRLLDGMTSPLRKQGVQQFSEDCDIVLDLGCGTGRSLELIENRIQGEAIGIDYSKAMIKESSKNKPNSSGIIRSDGRSIPLPKNSVDGVFMSLALTAMPEPEKVVSEVNRVTKKSGTVVVIDTTVPKSKLVKRAYRRIARWNGADVKRILNDEFESVETVREFDMGLGHILKAEN